MIVTRGLPVRTADGWRGRVDEVRANGWATIRWDVDAPSPVRSQDVPLESLVVQAGVVRFRSGA